MAEYVPIFDEGDQITYTADGAVTGGRAVEITGDRTVATTSGASAKCVGVPLFDAADGAKVTVQDGGVHEMTAGGAIAAGAKVQTAATGKVITWAGTVVTQIFGTALTAAAGADDLVQVKRP